MCGSSRNLTQRRARAGLEKEHAGLGPAPAARPGPALVMVLGVNLIRIEDVGTMITVLAVVLSVPLSRGLVVYLDSFIPVDISSNSIMLLYCFVYCLYRNYDPSTPQPCPSIKPCSGLAP